MAAGALILCVVLTLPVGKALLDVMRSGEYVTQRILWRSSPPGADAATLVLGHPRHALTGGVTRAAYDALQIDALEQSLWLGLVPLAVVAGWRRHWRGDPHAPVWLGVALVFGALAMGPFLRVAGIDTALPLPGALTRYIPIASNARIPGRAVIVLQLATAVLFALALKHRRPGRGLLSATAAFLILESAVAPAPIYPLPPADNVDRILAQSPSAGAVVELPSGLRDGFGELGAFDHRALVHQITHERPLVGGFVARLPPDLRRRYLETSVLRELIEPAAGSSADATLADDTAARARASGIAFLVVNRDVLAAGAYPRAALERAGFEFVHADGSRELYRSFRQ